MDVHFDWIVPIRRLLCFKIPPPPPPPYSPHISSNSRAKPIWTCFFFFCQCIIGSAEALPILCVRYFWWERERDTEREREREIEREREREIDGSDVTIVALKLAMSLHFPLPKTRTFRFSLHTSRLSLHGEVTMVALKLAITLSIAKKIFALGLCSPSFKWHEPRDEWSKTQDNWSNPAQSYFVLPIEKLNQINIPKTIGNRKRDCAWGGSGW